MLNANELWEQVLVSYERLTSNAAPSIDDIQAGIILTQAQEYYIKTRISKLLNPKRTGFEETEIRAQGLSALIKTAIITNFTNNADNLNNGVFVDLPLDFMYEILEQVSIDKNNCETNLPARLNVVFTSHNEVVMNSSNPFKKPYFNGSAGTVWRLVYSRQNSGFNSQTKTQQDGYSYITNQSGKRHELVTDGTFNITEYYLRYLKNPRPILVSYNDPSLPQQNCELDASTQQAIIDIAVNILKENYLQPKNPLQPSASQIE